MFPYLLPIFCFGLAMSGIVYLGIVRAADQAKSEATLEREQRDQS